ncbi:hypothetical protein OHD50_00915 [Escherichia coli]|nr:hypothetical protein [Escherichia coli]MCW7224536.1 hypothetical protein [Escherichia coli]
MTSKYLFGIGAAVLVYFGIKKLKKRAGQLLVTGSYLLVYANSPCCAVFFHNVPDSCFRQWIK